MVLEDHRGNSLSGGKRKEVKNMENSNKNEKRYLEQDDSSFLELTKEERLAIQKEAEKDNSEDRFKREDYLIKK